MPWSDRIAVGAYQGNPTPATSNAPSQQVGGGSHSLSTVMLIVVITLVAVIGVALLMWIFSSAVAMFTGDAGRRKAASAVSHRSHGILRGTTRSLGSIGNTAAAGLSGGSKRRRSSSRKRSGTKRKR